MNTITVSAVTALIAAGVNLAEQFPAGVNIVPDAADNAAAIPVPEVVTPAKEDGRNKAARAHNYEARIARRTSAANRKNAKGLTSAEKSDLYAELKAQTGKAAPSKAAWTKIVTAFKDSDCATVAEFIAQGC